MRAARPALAALLLAAAAPAGAELLVWIDAEGRTHVTDDAASIPADRRATAGSATLELRSLWDDGLAGPPLETPPGASGSEADRAARLLRGALEDLGRGETARAAAALAQVLRDDPARAEAHWYQALLEGQRGRLDASEEHLRAFLQSAGDRFEPWRRAAGARLARLADERRLLAPSDGALRLVALESPHFRLQLDEALRQRGDPDLPRRVLGYLDEARAAGLARLGLVPSEPTAVVLYGRAAYLRANGHRFSFQTVGFFDGRIHVASAAHPAGELRSLLYHEYVHALFREAAGGDRPFWLNEGLAELVERASKALPASTRSERARAHQHALAGTWIPLRRLAPSFAGLGDAEARLAYLEATAAAAWIEARTDAPARARLLRILGAGKSDDEALRATIGLDTRGLDAALRRELAAEFAPAN
jgi:hypothetical protein